MKTLLMTFVLLGAMGTGLIYQPYGYQLKPQVYFYFIPQK